MPVYAVTGNLGSGKTLVCVGRIRDALKRGARVATNLDLRLELLCPDVAPGHVVRLPDHPTADDLVFLGVGNDSRDESKNSLLVLDEAGAWLNSRGWQDKDRHRVIEWMLHARKLGWDVLLIVQDVSLLDKQVRVAFVEHLVRCRRLDRFPVPFIGPIVSLVGQALRLPQVHIANVFYGTANGSLCVERWVYRGLDLWGAYETRQIFRAEGTGLSSFLPPARYPWLRPGWLWLAVSRRPKSRLWKLIDWLIPLSDTERAYRAFRVAEQRLDTFQTLQRQSFAEWSASGSCDSAAGSVPSSGTDRDPAPVVA